MADYGAIRNKYLEGGKESTLAHVEEVANTAEWLGRIHGLDVEKLRLAAMLHDVSAVISPDEMYRIATERGMVIDPAEEKYRFLLHQRISKIMAEKSSGSPTGMCSAPLSAIRRFVKVRVCMIKRCFWLTRYPGTEAGCLRTTMS